LKISVEKVVENIAYAVNKVENKDSLNIWFKRLLKGNSLAIDVTKDKFNQSV
jgi:hypothetical protein